MASDVAVRALQRIDERQRGLLLQVVVLDQVVVDAFFDIPDAAPPGLTVLIAGSRT